LKSTIQVISSKIIFVQALARYNFGEFLGFSQKV
jgi:hypothetical protein